MNWYFAVEGNSHGPVSERELAEMARAGRVTTDTLIWHPGLDAWQPVSQLKPELVEPPPLNLSAMTPQSKDDTARIPVAPEPPPEKTGRGVFKRLFGWGKQG